MPGVLLLIPCKLGTVAKTKGLVAIGQETCPSFGVNGGSWQESLERYVRGDVIGPFTAIVAT
jgi:hypothetical protein